VAVATTAGVRVGAAVGAVVGAGVSVGVTVGDVVAVGVSTGTGVAVTAGVSGVTISPATCSTAAASSPVAADETRTDALDRSAHGGSVGKKNAAVKLPSSVTVARPTYCSSSVGAIKSTDTSSPACQPAPVMTINSPGSTACGETRIVGTDGTTAVGVAVTTGSGLGRGASARTPNAASTPNAPMIATSMRNNDRLFLFILLVKDPMLTPLDANT
jgi:hypothetical protein